MAKKCKQCGRMLDEVNFRPYKSRSKGVRHSAGVGTNTYCMDCEYFNSSMTRLWRTPVDSLSDKQKDYLEKAAALYREFAAAGLLPAGAYARHILGLGDFSLNNAKAKRAVTSADEYFDNVKSGKASPANRTPRPFFDNTPLNDKPAVPIQPFVDRYTDMLSMPLVDNPDVYIEMHEKLQDECPKDETGLRVAVSLKRLDTELTCRLNEYEDSYWAKGPKGG